MVTRILILLLLLTPNVMAAPTAGDTTAANAEFDLMDQYQTGYYAALSKYNQVADDTKNGIVYSTHVYDGPSGKGCIHNATKTEGSTLYRLQRHAGPESRTIDTVWTDITPEEE